MLERGSATKAVSGQSRNVNCDLQLPVGWQRDLSGPHPLAPEDDRRFPRFHYRVGAVVQSITTLPAFPRSGQRHLVYTVDVSRGGLGFLHNRELFPGERVLIVLPDQVDRELSVVRCIREADHCFRIGCGFPTPLEPAGVRDLQKLTGRV